MAASPCYQERLTTGLYDSLVEDLLKLDKSVLANIDWGKDFRRDPQDKLQLIYADGRPFTTLIFGEIARPLWVPNTQLWEITIWALPANQYVTTPLYCFSPDNLF